MSPSTRTNNANPPTRSIVSGESAATVVRTRGKTRFCFDFAAITRFFFGVFLAGGFCTGVWARRTGAAGGGAGGGGC